MRVGNPMWSMMANRTKRKRVMRAMDSSKDLIGFGRQDRQLFRFSLFLLFIVTLLLSKSLRSTTNPNSESMWTTVSILWQQTDESLMVNWLIASIERYVPFADHSDSFFGLPFTCLSFRSYVQPLSLSLTQHSIHSSTSIFFSRQFEEWKERKEWKTHIDTKARNWVDRFSSCLTVLSGLLPLDPNPETICLRNDCQQL